jgi:flagellar hook-associated protein 3 FlgL
MSLRVTQGMMTSQLVRNLNNNLGQMSKIENQMSTGRSINKPSDDPVGVTYALRYRSELSANGQYKDNVDNALSRLSFSDKMLDQVGTVMNRIKELTVQASTGTNTQSGLDSINKEVVDLKEQLVNIGNSQLNGKYVFNGQNFDMKPYESATAATAVTDDGDVVYQLSSGVVASANVSGNAVFGTQAETDNVFKLLDNLSAALSPVGDFNAISALLPDIESRATKVLNERSAIGARVNRVELMESRLGDLEVILTDLQSKTEDIDYEKILIQSKVNDNIYQASLAVGAKIITPTLVSFLS